MKSLSVLLESFLAICKRGFKDTFNIVLIIAISLLLGTTFLFSGGYRDIAHADEAEDIQKEIDDKKKELEETESDLSNIKKKADDISNNIKKLAGDLGATQGQINTLKSQINELSADIDNLNKKMDLKNQQIQSQKKVRDSTIRDLYISGQKGFFVMMLNNGEFENFIQNAAYTSRLVDDSKNLIGTINTKINAYESDKKEIEVIKTQIEKQKADLQALATKIQSQVNAKQGELAAVSQKKVALEQERGDIQKKLSELSAKQQALLQEKTGTFTTSVGDVPTTGDPNSQASYDPGFRKAFAAFSFGAPHRKGMSQYGAKGRADAGQNYEQILKAYYGNIEIEKPELPSKINTTSGEMDLDGKYLKGLAEMPASWPMEAMKAQAVAARTYAMSYVGWRTGNNNPGGKICTTESCQVWSSSKASSSSASRWHEAVEATKGQVMLGKDSGEIFSAFYAASSGGYNYSYSSLGHNSSGGWDTKCGSRDCWTSEAYESKAGSPWFYKGWYKTRSNETCGRKHPWLTEAEFADIIGAMVLYKENSDNQTHLSQPDAKTCWGEDIDDTWSRDDVKSKSGIEKVDSVSVTYSNGGQTAEVKVSTNKGEQKFSGEEFKAIFNLRAPGAIHLTSMLFNIEVRK